MLQMLNYSLVEYTPQNTQIPVDGRCVLFARLDCAGAQNVALFCFHLHAHIQQTLTVLLKCQRVGQKAAIGKTYRYVVTAGWKLEHLSRAPRQHN